MHSQLQKAASSRRVLVLATGPRNQLHELHEHRLAEALRSLGLLVEVGEFGDCKEDNYDWCLLTNISDILHNNQAHALQRLTRRCRAIAYCSFDCSNAASYKELQRHRQAAGIDTLLDFGLHERSAIFGRSAASRYHHILNGLTPSEREIVRRGTSNREERPIPWVFVDSAAAQHAALVNHLITRLDPCGCVYMPNGTQTAASETGRFKQQQYQKVLQKSRYHICYSAQQPFYLDSERFRLALLAGCVPIKIVSADENVPAPLPFDYLVVRDCEAAEKIRQYDFHELRDRFRADFLALPSLAASLAKFLTSQSILPGWEPLRVLSQAA